MPQAALEIFRKDLRVLFDRRKLAPPDRFILAVHIASTLYMTGVIWPVQLGAYPSFCANRAGASEKLIAHSERIRWIAGPGMSLKWVRASCRT